MCEGKICIGRGSSEQCMKYIEILRPTLSFFSVHTNMKFDHPSCVLASLSCALVTKDEYAWAS